MNNQGNNVTVQPVDASCTAVVETRKASTAPILPQNKQRELLAHIFEILLAAVEGDQ
ncbi:MAG: hypothetical protein IMZ61_10770 [Planctomycetes bacterium]|nr:hypothetical protein [Planctomycetota bacterium]